MIPVQPRSQGVLTSYADHEAEQTPWYISIKFAQKMGKFGSHHGFHRWLGKRRKMAVALALILQKMSGELKTNTLRTLFEPFCRYLNNNLGSASVLTMKTSLLCLERKWASGANSGNFHRSLKNKMTRYSSIFGNKLQMMVGISKKRGFTSNFDISRSFTSRKSDLRPKMANSQSDCRAASCIPEQR